MTNAANYDTGVLRLAALKESPMAADNSDQLPQPYNKDNYSHNTFMNQIRNINKSCRLGSMLAD